MNWVKQRKAWAGTCTPSEHDWGLALSWAGARSAQDYEPFAGAAYSAIVEGVECATLAFDDVGLSVPCNQSLYLVGGSGPCLCVPAGFIAGKLSIRVVLELLHLKIHELGGQPDGCLYLGAWRPENADAVYFDIASGIPRYDHAVSTMMARSDEEALFDIKEGKLVQRKDILDTLLVSDREKGLEAYRQWQAARFKA